MRHFLILLAVVFAVGCNGSALTGGGTDSPDGGSDADPGDPHNGADPDVPDTFPTEGDDDGDGIPDADDFIPCLAIYALVWNQEVSSAEVALNTQVIVDSSYFPTDEIFIEFINPVPGMNEMTFGGRVAGSPEDQLHVEVWDTEATANIYLHVTIIRENGTPEEPRIEFEVNPSC